eukprot:scaffold9439_cov115-Cylindrotheca_fusiformis.AAC.4
MQIAMLFGSAWMAIGTGILLSWLAAQTGSRETKTDTGIQGSQMKVCNMRIVEYITQSEPNSSSLFDRLSQSSNRNILNSWSFDLLERENQESSHMKQLYPRSFNFPIALSASAAGVAVVVAVSNFGKP